MKNKRTLIITIVSLVVCIVAVGAIVLTKSIKANKVSDEMVLGYKYMADDDFSEAIKAFEHVLDMDPKNLEAKMGLADVYIKTEKYKKAERQLEEILDIQKDYIDAYIKLADIKILEGYYEEAIELLEEALDEHSDRKLKNKLNEIKELEDASKINDVPPPPSSPPDTVTPEPSSTSSPVERPIGESNKGNSASNIINRGSFASQNNLLFYSNMSDNNSLYVSPLDGDSTKKLNDELSVYINVIDDWIYYYTGDDICRVRPDGSDRQVILGSVDCFYMNVIDNWIYYCEYSYTDGTETDYGKIYKLRVDGSERIKLSDDDVNVMIVDEYANWVYYSCFDGAIYRIQSDGTNKMNLVESGFLRAVEDIDGMEYVYYYYYNNDTNFQGGLFRIESDGTNESLITEDSIYFMNVSGEWIYYANASDSGLYKINSDGSQKTRLTDDFCFNIHVIEDWIYYFYDDGSLIDNYKIKTDGTENQLFLQNN